MEAKMGNWPRIAVDMEKEFAKCFGCGQDNPIGLKLRFVKDGKTVKAEFTPGELHQGWSGVLHGGITMTLLDEATSYAALLEGINTVTARLEVRLRRPILIGQPLYITGSIAKRAKRTVETKGAIFLKDGTLGAEANGTQFIIDAETKKSSDDKKRDQKQS
jgi:uncharacterized protein (TIGR00369 family)